MRNWRLLSPYQFVLFAMSSSTGFHLRCSACTKVMASARTCWPQLWLSRSAITRRTASGVLPAAESEMIVTALLGYCWACACTWAAADSGSSQKHAIIRKCERNLTFMSPALDQFARATACFCTRSLLIVVAEAPARRSRRIGPDKPFLAAHQRSANRVTLAKNIMTQLRWPLQSRVIHLIMTAVLTL